MCRRFLADFLSESVHEMAQALKDLAVPSTLEPLAVTNSEAHAPWGGASSLEMGRLSSGVLGSNF